jgi:hypothetical protein
MPGGQGRRSPPYHLWKLQGRVAVGEAAHLTPTSTFIGNLLRGQQ